MFYNFKMFMEHFQKGKMYSLPEKCIHISILDFDYRNCGKIYLKDYCLFEYQPYTNIVYVCL